MSDADKTVLVAQSQPRQLNLWKLAFVSQGFQLIEIPCQENTVEKNILDREVNLVLLDLNTRSFNPYLFCRKVLKKYPHLPVVLTNHKKQKISDVEYQLAVTQGATTLIPEISNRNQLTPGFKKLLKTIGWDYLLNEKALKKLEKIADRQKEIVKQTQQKYLPKKQQVIDRNFLVNLCHEMRLSEGLEVKDRRWKLRIFEKCFVGQEAVSWLCTRLQISRLEAVKIGQKFLEQGYLFHVLQEHDFKDGYFYYRFFADGFPSQRIFF